MIAGAGPTPPMLTSRPFSFPQTYWRFPRTGLRLSPYVLWVRVAAPVVSRCRRQFQGIEIEAKGQLGQQRLQSQDTDARSGSRVLRICH